MVNRFFALFEVIATLLDDILVMSEVTAKKIASVLSDDLAVNAETWCIVDALKRSTLRGFRADKIDIEKGRREMGEITGVVRDKSNDASIVLAESFTLGITNSLPGLSVF